MKHLQEERKLDLANYLSKLTLKLNLPRTAQTLSQEARLTCLRDVEQDIQEITAGDLNEAEQREKLRDYFRTYLRRLLKEGLLQEAAQLFENYVSKYSLDLNEFAMLFAGEQEKESLEVEHIFKDFLQENKELPQTRADFHYFHNQVWFARAVQDKLFAVDDKSNAKVLEASVVVAEKSKLHAGKTIYVTSNGSTMVATAGQDKLLRVWDKDINLVYQSKVHASKITSLEFIPNTDCLMSCDYGGTLVVHHIFRKELPLRLVKTRPLVDVKYMSSKSKGRIVGLASETAQSELIFLSIQENTIKKRKKIEGRSYNFQVSSAHQLIFVNKTSSVIQVYSSVSCDLKFKLTGYLQKNFLTRMSVGGPDGNFLAVTSEDGHICLYNFKKPDLFTKIRVSNTPVNCVAWIGSELYMGCDSGYIEIWTSNLKKYQQKTENIRIEHEKLSKKVKQ